MLDLPQTETPARWLYARLKPLIEDAVARADAVDPIDDQRDRRGFLDIAVALSRVLLAYRPAL
jgi:hypothetical protein